MKIVCSISIAEAKQLASGKDATDLVYVETRHKQGGHNIYVHDRFAPVHYYRFEVRENGEPVHHGSEVILHPVERIEHTTYTYRDQP